MPSNYIVMQSGEMQLLTKALNEHKTSKAVFDALPRSRQQEIIRYISFLKTEESIIRNVVKAIDFLSGKARFVGRDKPCFTDWFFKLKIGNLQYQLTLNNYYLWYS